MTTSAASIYGDVFPTGEDSYAECNAWSFCDDVLVYQLNGHDSLLDYIEIYEFISATAQ